MSSDRVQTFDFSSTYGKFRVAARILHVYPVRSQSPAAPCYQILVGSTINLKSGQDGRIEKRPYSYSMVPCGLDVLPGHSLRVVYPARFVFSHRPSNDWQTDLGCNPSRAFVARGSDFSARAGLILLVEQVVLGRTTSGIELDMDMHHLLRKCMKHHNLVSPHRLTFNRAKPPGLLRWHQSLGTSQS